MDLPDDVAKALDGVPHARSRFDALPPSHKAEYLAWIGEAKKAVTRARRIAGMLERLTWRKAFFFEKKEAKTFMSWAACRG